ncbi:hypothetical protein BGZ58_000540 [Dissophora ornata]|nr:hypothetical protein BGZ58_000540 [Dissophora ornata]
MFHGYKANLLEHKAAAISPLADSLAAALSSIHNEFQELKAQVRNLTAEVRDFLQPVSSSQLPSLLSQLLPDTDNVDVHLERISKMVADERKAKAGGSERSKPAECPQFVMLSHDAPLENVWNEWFRGVEDWLSVREMNKWYQHKWHKVASKSESNANAVLYLFKKHIVRSILIAFPPELELQEGEAAAFAVVKGRITRVRSINQYFKSLPKGEPKRFKKNAADSQESNEEAIDSVTQ